MKGLQYGTHRKYRQIRRAAGKKSRVIVGNKERMTWKQIERAEECSGQTLSHK